MKVYVTTKTRPFRDEQFIGVYGSKKALRTEFPFMRPVDDDPNCFVSDINDSWILFIHEREI